MLSGEKLVFWIDSLAFGIPVRRCYWPEFLLLLEKKKFSCFNEHFDLRILGGRGLCSKKLSY